MKLTFLGAAHEVTGSCTLLEACGKRILIDCGMEQGKDIYENCELPVAAGQIDAILLTHAHIDHSGKLPAMVAGGFTGPIYATQATRRLCNIMLLDAAHIQESEAEWKNRKSKRAGGEIFKPLYTTADAQKTLGLFESCLYGDVLEIFSGICVKFQDAGHLLGSSSIYVTVTEEGQKRTVLFSGDLGNISRPLIRDPQMPEQADFVVVESTYGDRTHGPRPDYLKNLTEVMQETFGKGGNLVIPAFAVGRTQELLYLMRTIKEQNLVPEPFHVYVDSPMAVEATRIYADGMTEFYDQETLELLAQGKDPITFPGLKLSITSEESKLINFDTTPKVILSASGMCEAGRIRHHLKHNLWREDSTILFVGYQTAGTLGRRLLDGVDFVKLFGEEIAVNARIETMAGISGHADKDMLLNWLKALPQPPKRVFVNHGEDAVTDSFADTVSRTLGYATAAPYSGDCYDLVTDTCVHRAAVVRVKKVARGNEVYRRLVEAGKRLAFVIENSKGMSNKLLARFTDQIIKLCDKYEK